MLSCTIMHEEEDTCHMSYEEEDTCHMSYEEEDACHMSYEEEDTCHMSYEEEDTCYPILSCTWVMRWVGRRGLVGDGQLEKATACRASPARGTRGVSARQVKLNAAHVVVRLCIPIGTWV